MPSAREGFVAAHERRVVLTPNPDGWWTVECPSIPGCISQGATRDEALANIREAIHLCIESYEAEGEPVPEDRMELATVEV
jgi:predicted RNase H-like HicB family nuclease